MTLTNYFLCLHVLLVLATLGAWSLRLLKRSTPRQLLQLQYWLLGLVLLLPLATALRPSSSPFTPLAHTYQARSFQEWQMAPEAEAKLQLDLPVIAPRGVSVDWIGTGVATLLTLTWLVSLALVLRELWCIRRLLQNSLLLRARGKVRLVCSSQIQVPFSFRGLAHAWVVLPATLLDHPRELRMALHHELQHHRQGDTLWQYALLLLRGLAGVNPCFRLFQALISESQELTVDATLVDEGRVSPRDYAHCLVMVATNAIGRPNSLASTTGMVGLTDRHQLARRIETMFALKMFQRWHAPLWGLTLTLTLSAVALKVGNAIGDTGLTLAQVEKLVEETPSQFPLKVNERVVTQLNRYLQTSQGRNFLRDAFDRMEFHRPIVEAALKDYGVPTELMAIPVVESGYRNLAQNPDGGLGAGLWMFIPNTAMAYGLQVWDGVDQRLNIPKETDAAMRLLKAEKIRFGKWPLSVLAYNAGDKMVTRGIFRTGSHDAWELDRQGYRGDKNYLAKLTAVILVMKHPELLH